jgi:hypothetical protein
VMHMGGMKFKQRGREEQAEADGVEVWIQTPSTPTLPYQLRIYSMCRVTEKSVITNLYVSRETGYILEAYQ